MNLSIGPFKITNDFVAEPLKLANTNHKSLDCLNLNNNEDINIDEFFNYYSSENRYLFKKESLLDYIKFAKFEYLTNTYNQYLSTDIDYYKQVLDKINDLDELIYFILDKNENKSGYYIKSEDYIFNFVLREVALPEITNLFILKDGNNYEFVIDLDYNLMNNKKQNDYDSYRIKSSLNLPIAYQNYMKSIDYEDTSAYSYVTALRGPIWKGLFEGEEPVDAYKIYEANEFKDLVNKLKATEAYEKMNPNTRRRVKIAFETYAKFLESRSNMPHQLIFFGAPGTGKSYRLKQLSLREFDTNIERVTFHPNYMYGNLVGSYKPFVSPNKNPESEDLITYKFIPGPLIRQLINAYKKPDENFLIIIEEINRANVSAVFGDTFQLLDRSSDGFSEYMISTSEELRNYLVYELIDEKGRYKISQELKDILGPSFEHLTFPSNLYIWATMNSADQGVMPMDTAFKRRWEFKYIGIDEGVSEDFKNYKFRVGPGLVTSWNEFRVKVNEKLEKYIPEDKLMGPYFIPKSILESDIDTITEAIRDKVLIYLYDDAAKPFRNQLFDPEKSRKFSDLRKYFDQDALGIFKERLDIVPEKIENEEVYENQVNDSLKSDNLEVVDNQDKSDIDY